MKRRRVLFFAAVHDFKGGAEQSLLDLITNPSIDAHVAAPAVGPIKDHCDARGLAFHCIAFGSIDQVKRPVKILSVFSALRDTIIAARNLKEISERQNIDIIHSNGLKPHVISLVSRYLFRSPPVIVHIRDIPYTPIEKFLWKYISAFAQKTILVSRFCLPGGADRDGVSVVPNGVAPVADLSRDLFSGVPSIRLGFVGRLHPHKGLHNLIDWIGEARNRGFDCTLTVRGAFPKDSFGYEARIAEQISRLGLDNVVRFEGFVAERRNIYHDIDIVCAPSEAAEPFGRVAIEAMAHGLLVFASPIGGFRDIIDDQLNGYFVGDCETFIRCLSIVLKDIQAARNVAGNGFSHAGEKFSIEKLHSNINSIYERSI